MGTKPKHFVPHARQSTGEDLWGGKRSETQTEITKMSMQRRKSPSEVFASSERCELQSVSTTPQLAPARAKCALNTMGDITFGLCVISTDQFIQCEHRVGQTVLHHLQVERQQWQTLPLQLRAPVGTAHTAQHKQNRTQEAPMLQKHSGVLKSQEMMPKETLMVPSPSPFCPRFVTRPVPTRRSTALSLLQPPAAEQATTSSAPSAPYSAKKLLTSLHFSATERNGRRKGKAVREQEKNLVVAICSDQSHQSCQTGEA